MKLFEKFAALIFLVLLVGMVAFLTFIPLPSESEKVILMIIGGLMTSAATALPQLFGVEDSEKEKLKERVRKLEEDNAVIKMQYQTLHDEHTRIMNLLVERHVVTGEGNTADRTPPHAAIR